MWPLWSRLAFRASRSLFGERLRRAFEERDPADAAPLARTGKLFAVSWLFAVWQVASEVAWIMGEHPRWSARRFRLGPAAETFAALAFSPPRTRTKQHRS